MSQVYQDTCPNKKSVKKNLSVTAGRTKNIHKWTPITWIPWKMTFPRMDFFRYRARSTTIRANWRISMMRKGTGTLFSWRYELTPSDDPPWESRISRCVKENQESNGSTFYDEKRGKGWKLTPKAENPKTMTRKLTKSQMNMEAYTSTVTRYGGWRMCLINFTKGEDVFFVLDNKESIHTHTDNQHMMEEWLTLSLLISHILPNTWSILQFHSMRLFVFNHCCIPTSTIINWYIWWRWRFHLLFSGFFFLEFPLLPQTQTL